MPKFERQCQMCSLILEMGSLDKSKNICVFHTAGHRKIKAIIAQSNH